MRQVGQFNETSVELLGMAAAVAVETSIEPMLEKHGSEARKNIGYIVSILISYLVSLNNFIKF